jgi:large subunit ribosomal protein L24
MNTNAYRQGNIKNKIMMKKHKNNNYRQWAIKTGDMVQIITGKDKKKQGKVLEVDRTFGRVKVEGMKMQTHYKKDAGLILKEGFMHISNVMLFDTEVKKVTRYKFGTNEEGKKIRMSVTSNKAI